MRITTFTTIHALSDPPSPSPSLHSCRRIMADSRKAPVTFWLCFCDGGMVPVHLWYVPSLSSRHCTAPFHDDLTFKRQAYVRAYALTTKSVSDPLTSLHFLLLQARSHANCGRCFRRLSTFATILPSAVLIQGKHHFFLLFPLPSTSMMNSNYHDGLHSFMR